MLQRKNIILQNDKIQKFPSAKITLITEEKKEPEEEEKLSNWKTKQNNEEI